MNHKQKIAKRFGVDSKSITYRPGKGWFYASPSDRRLRFLHKSYYELQHTAAWSTKDITKLWVGDR